MVNQEWIPIFMGSKWLEKIFLIGIVVVIVVLAALNAAGATAVLLWRASVAGRLVDEAVGGMREGFDGRVLLSDVDGYLNLVGFGLSPSPAPELATLRARAIAIGGRTGIALTGTLDRMEALNPVEGGAFVL